MNLQRFRDLVARLAKERRDEERPALEVGTAMHKSMELVAKQQALARHRELLAKRNEELLAKERCVACGSEYTEDVNDTTRCFLSPLRKKQLLDELAKSPVAQRVLEVDFAKAELAIHQQLREAFLAFCEKHGVDAEELAKLNLSGGERIHIDPPWQTQGLAQLTPEDRQLVRRFGWGFGRPTGLMPKGRALWNFAMKAIRWQDALNMIHDSIYVHVQTPVTTSDGRRVTSTSACDGYNGTKHDATKVFFCKAQDAWLCSECHAKLGIAPPFVPPPETTP